MKSFWQARDAYYIVIYDVRPKRHSLERFAFAFCSAEFFPFRIELLESKWRANSFAIKYLPSLRSIWIYVLFVCFIQFKFTGQVSEKKRGENVKAVHFSFDISFAKCIYSVANAVDWNDLRHNILVHFLSHFDFFVANFLHEMRSAGGIRIGLMQNL